jgi:hypothetical protein
MYQYLETLTQWLENSVIIIGLFLIILFIIGSGFFTYKIIKKIKEIKLKVAGAEVDIQIEAPTTDTEEIKPSEGAEK